MGAHLRFYSSVSNCFLLFLCAVGWPLCTPAWERVFSLFNPSLHLFAQSSAWLMKFLCWQRYLWSWWWPSSCVQLTWASNFSLRTTTPLVLGVIRSLCAQDVFWPMLGLISYVEVTGEIFDLRGARSGSSTIILLVPRSSLRLTHHTIINTVWLAQADLYITLQLLWSLLRLIYRHCCCCGARSGSFIVTVVVWSSLRLTHWNSVYSVFLIVRSGNMCSGLTAYMCVCVLCNT